MGTGTCKLTGATGKFVRSHLLPLALTRSGTPGTPLTQFGSGSKPVRRWSSWYDEKLVTDEGEAILQDYDGWAITAMRAKHLLWSGWGPMNSLGSMHEQIPGTSIGVRLVQGIDTRRLRLFFLSLLWRAAATERPDFSEVKVSRNDLEMLRCMVQTGNPEPLDFYPVSLTQLSTRGEPHNLTPLAMDKMSPEIADIPAEVIPIFRFYFDGLIAHFDRRPGLDVQALGPLIVGAAGDLTVSTVTYEDSSQLMNSEALQEEMLSTFGKPKWWP